MYNKIWHYLKAGSTCPRRLDNFFINRSDPVILDILFCILQAWLYAKVEMAHQARLNKPDPNLEKQAKEAKESEAQTAYSVWLDTKRKQDKALRQLEESRRAEEASQYAIRDRQVCDEAFRRWASCSQISKCQPCPPPPTKKNCHLTLP